MNTIKLDIGTIYKKTSKGSYYFRYQINGQRKAISLKTKNKDEAITKAKELLPILKSSSVEIISAHVKHARGLAKKQQTLRLPDAWTIYSKHPERATPATVSEQNSYKATYDEFVNYLDDSNASVNDITFEMSNRFADYLREQEIAVDTHNRKIRRLKKIFDVLKDYREDENPFTAKSLRRKEREEQDSLIKRTSFTREQEQKLLEVLNDNKYKVKNKPEIRVIYYIGMFTGQRFKDCVLLRWDKINLKRRRIQVKQFKTGKEVTIPIAFELLEIIYEAEKWKVNNYVCPSVAERYNKKDSNGKNVGNNLVNIDAIRVIKWIGLEPSVEVPGRKKKVTVYGFHSLRHSFVSYCAEAGVPKAVVLSIIGTNSDIVDKHYTHIGEEAQEKAIAAISGGFNLSSITPQEKIDKALKIINNLQEKNEVIKKIEEVLK